ncbi:MAG: hypothetical protein IV100_26105 [Myxococcales bacterium]|nr:hypothetical protein [Myxococcales bacterium]
MRFRLLGTVGAIALGAAACGDDGAVVAAVDAIDGTDVLSDVTADVGPSADESSYTFTVALPSGVAQTYAGVLVPSQHISFGCTHLPPPVRSLAIEITYPKPFSTLSMNLGFVIGDAEHPLTIEDVGLYPWGQGDVNSPPAMKLITKDGSGGPQLTLASWVPGASGTVKILKWSIEEGGVVEGELLGTLKNEGRIDATASISGEFRLVLPAPEGCGAAQPVE